jgi:hypothetical protein
VTAPSPAVAIFSDDWFSDVETAIARDHAGVDGPDLSVEYRCSGEGDDIVHSQVWSGGRLVSWIPGPSPRLPDVCLVQPLATNLAMLGRTGDGNTLMSGTSLFDAASGHIEPVPFVDEVVVDWAAGLPEIPTAGPLVMAQVATRSPFGTVGVEYRIERATVVAVRIGGGDGRFDDESAAEPDVVVRRTYRNCLLERAGQLDVLESLDGGDVRGSVHALSYLLGVWDSDECRAARRRLGRSGGALGDLGELLSRPSWTGTFAPLLRRPGGQ